MKKQHWNKGRKRTPEQIKRLSDAHIGVQAGEKHPNWKGGRTITSDGYVCIRSPNHPHQDNKKYVKEHRLVMEKHLGRYLKPEEVCASYQRHQR